MCSEVESGVGSQGVQAPLELQAPLEAAQGKNMDSPLKPPGGMQFCGHLYFSLGRPHFALLCIFERFLFLWMWTIFKVFIGLVTLLLLFYVLVFLAARHMGS